MSKRPRLRCFCCGKTGFLTYEEYRDHILKDHKEEEGVMFVVCPYCEYPVRDVKSHCKLKHKDRPIPKIKQTRARVWKDWDAAKRKMVRSKKGKGKRNFQEGYFVSEKNSYQSYHYRSSWELYVMECLEEFCEVRSWQSEPFGISYQLHGKQRLYLPDFLIDYKDGTKLMVEVKPKHETIDPDDMNKAKWDSAQRYCFARQWRFEVWTENFISEMRRRRRALLENRNLKTKFPDVNIL